MDDTEVTREQGLSRGVFTRRDALMVLGGLGAGSLLGSCGGSSANAIGSMSGESSSSSSSSSASSSSVSTSTTSSSTASTQGCTLIPEETAGPYPGDGSNATSRGVINALTLSGIVRSNIVSSIAGATGIASGVKITVTLQLVGTQTDCSPLAGRAIYLWHCNAAGQYSMYSAGVTEENYLRGVQVTDSTGRVSFATIVPGCYDGRVPHMHFEVYPSLASAVGANNKIRTSQLTFPTAMLSEVYALSAYSGSAANLAKVSLATDNVFSDGYSSQIASVTGDTASGYTATLQIGIAA